VDESEVDEIDDKISGSDSSKVSMEQTYAQMDRERADKTSKKGPGIEEGSAMDHFVNPTAGGYANCRRCAPGEYFGRRQGEYNPKCVMIHDVVRCSHDHCR
jgi:hypothetical protein